MVNCFFGVPSKWMKALAHFLKCSCLQMYLDFLYSLGCFWYFSNVFQSTKRCFQGIIFLLSFTTWSKSIKAPEEQFATASREHRPQLQSHTFRKLLFCVHSCETQDVAHGVKKRRINSSCPWGRYTLNVTKTSKN